MQIKKDDVRDRILAAAKAEFLELGFEKASLRSIAQSANVSTGNMYNYFRNKDDLFCQTVETTVTIIKEAIEAREKFDVFSGSQLMDLNWHLRRVESAARFVHDHRDDIRLIVDRSHGSSLSSFKQWAIDRNADISDRFLDYMVQRSGYGNMQISGFFFENVAGFVVNFFCELARTDAGYDEMADYSREFVTYIYYGYLGLLGIDQGKSFMKEICEPSS